MKQKLIHQTHTLSIQFSASAFLHYCTLRQEEKCLHTSTLTNRNHKLSQEESKRLN